METPRQFNNLAALVNYHLDLHDGIEVRDIYKLIHQSVFGPEHLGKGASENAIAEEMQSAEEVEFAEPLLEPISIDAGACRVNLRVARDSGIPASLLAGAVQLSATTFAGDRSEFARLWRELGSCLENLARKFDIENFKELTRATAEKDFPPLHHSETYRHANRPAYRVLKSGELERLMRGWRANCR